MTKYRTAVIGLSEIGRARPSNWLHQSVGHTWPYSHVAAYQAVEHTELVAVCDRDPQAVSAFQKEWHDLYSHLPTFSDHRKMLDEIKPDIVSLALPDNRHAAVFIDCCRAGVKAIYCEKPLATTLADAQSMIEAAETCHIKVAVNHQRRWMPTVLNARELIRSGGIGDLVFLTATQGGPRAMLFRNGAHAIDMLVYLALDRDVKWVMSRLGSEFDDYGPAYRGDGGRDPKGDPDGQVLIGFDKGVRGLYNAARHAAAKMNLEVLGTQGRIRIWEDPATGSLIQGTWEKFDEESRWIRSSLPEREMTSVGMEAAVRDLVGAIETQTETLSSSQTALRTVTVLVAALQSHAARGAVIWSPFEDSASDRQAG